MDIGEACFEQDKMKLVHSFNSDWNWASLMSTMGVAFLAAPKHDDLRNLQFHWVKQSLMTLKFRRYLARARARARARTALVKRGASGPYPKKCLAFFLAARACFWFSTSGRICFCCSKNQFWIGGWIFVGSFFVRKTSFPLRIMIHRPTDQKQHSVWALARNPMLCF